MSTVRVTSVFIVDHHDIVREGLASILGREADLKVTGQAASIRDAFAAIGDDPPDFLIANEELPDGSGLDLSRAIVRNGWPTRVLLLADHRGPDAGSSKRFGVATFPKNDEPEALIRAIRSTDAALVVEDVRLEHHLPPHLLRVLSALPEGRKVHEIAVVLNLSTHTVKTYMRQLYATLGTTSRAQTVAVGVRKGLL